MDTIDSMIMSIEEYTSNANCVKELVLDRLYIDGLITVEQYNNYIEKWNIIIIKTNWFSKWMKKFKKEKDSYHFKYVNFEA